MYFSVETCDEVIEQDDAVSPSYKVSYCIDWKPSRYIKVVFLL